MFENVVGPDRRTKVDPHETGKIGQPILPWLEEGISMEEALANELVGRIGKRLRIAPDVLGENISRGSIQAAH